MGYVNGLQLLAVAALMSFGTQVVSGILLATFIRLELELSWSRIMGLWSANAFLWVLQT